jgi:hypothetical protein
MPWITRKPGTIDGLAAAEPLLRTEASVALARGYRALMAARPDGGIPSKRALDLGPLRPAMPHLVLTAVTRPDRCIYRLAGEEVKARIGMNPVGRNYYDLVPEERRAHAARAMHMVIGQPCGFRAEIAQSYSDGRTRTVECLGLPLASDEPGVDGFILFADCQIGSGEMQTERTLLLGANVVRRELIDLGFGVDDSFEDIVRVD